MAALETGLVQVALGRNEAGVLTLSAVVEQLSALQSEVTPQQADALVGWGRALLALGRPDDAQARLIAADRFWRDFDPGNRWAGEAAFWLGHCYSALGKRNEAKQAYTRATRILARSPLPADAKLVQLAQRD